jgi:hypothetical protein
VLMDILGVAITCLVCNAILSEFAASFAAI